MLGAGRYLLGVAELAVLAGFATLGAARVRARLLPDFGGAPGLLATAVIALGVLTLVAEALGSFGLFEAVPYLVGVAVAGLGMWAIGPRVLSRGKGGRCGRGVLDPPFPRATRGREVTHPLRESGVVATGLASLVVVAAVVHFAAGVRLRLSTGMTGFDSTWYHGPLAVEFFQTGNTFELHFLAPQYLAWFYPANAELFHSMGMLVFHRDILSPLLNFGWFLGCLFAGWCIGRAFRVGAVSLALVAIGLSVPVLGDQAGEARNDLVGIFFLLAAVAVAVNAWEGRPDRRLSTGALVVVGLAAGLAAGTKLDFVPAAVVLVAGLVAIAPRGGRWRALAAAGLPALAGGGYWYLRNLAQTGNPLPWVRHLGPIALPAPAQALGGREGHSVLEYLTDGSVWSHWFLPGLHQGLWIVWPLLGGMALAGLLLCLGRGASPLLRVIGLVGLVAGLTWLLAPDFGRGAGGDARRVRVGAALPDPGPDPRPGDAAGDAPPEKASPPLDVSRPALEVDSPRLGRGLPRRPAAACGGGVRLPRAAQLPAAPLRQARIHHQGPRRRLQMGPHPLQRPHSHDQHPPVPPIRHRPLQPRPVRRGRTPPWRLRPPQQPAEPGAGS